MRHISAVLAYYLIFLQQINNLQRIDNSFVLVT